MVMGRGTWDGQGEEIVEGLWDGMMTTEEKEKGSRVGATWRWMDGRRGGEQTRRREEE